MAHEVFISYSSKDKVIADAVCAKLEENKIRVWIAPRDVLPSKDFAEAVIDAIDDSKVFVLIWSEDSNKSEHILNEVNRAFSKSIAVLPFRINDVEPTKSLEYYIGRTHWLDAITPPIEKHIDELVDIVQAILGKKREEIQATETGYEHANSAQLANAHQTQKDLPRPKHNRRLYGVMLGCLAIMAIIVRWLILNQPTGITVPSTFQLIATDSPAIKDFVNIFSERMESGWSWMGEDKSHWKLPSSAGSLQITLKEKGWYDKGLPHNWLLRDSPMGNFAIEIKMGFLPISNFQFAGLIFYQDDGNALHLGRAYCDEHAFSSCVGDGIYFDSAKSSTFDPANFATPLSHSSEIFLRLTREGNIYSGYYSLDGSTWIKVGDHKQDFISPRIGLYTGQSTVENPISADFYYFKVIPLP